MSDTPRTDSFNWTDDDDSIVECYQFACQLERELNEADERIKRLEERERHIEELESRLRALWDKYDCDSKHYMKRIKRLEEAGDALAAIIGPPGSPLWTYEDSALNNWTKAKEAK